MIPIVDKFPGSTGYAGAPEGMTKEQVRTIACRIGTIIGGNLDGVDYAVTAWKPTPEELQDLNNGGLVYLSVLGGIPPHYLTTKMEEACYGQTA